REQHQSRRIGNGGESAGGIRTVLQPVDGDRPDAIVVDGQGCGDQGGSGTPCDAGVGGHQQSGGAVETDEHLSVGGQSVEVHFSDKGFRCPDVTSVGAVDQ